MSHTFIAQYDGAFSKDYCQRVINFYENASSAGLTASRQRHEGAGKLAKEDNIIFCSSENSYRLDKSTELIKEFSDIFWEHYKQYALVYPVLNDLAGHKIYEFKIQKTEPGQGYHVWHCESDSRESATRLLVWTLYLNDIEDGGETEFLYQHLRVKPKTGTLVIWPAGFTHVHRGNPPLKDTKYIVTGWVEF